MQLDTPEGTLTIDDKELRFEPSDGGEEIAVSLDPVPDYRYERGIYGTGTLVVGGKTIALDADQAETVVAELRRARPTSGKSRKSDADTATAK